MDRVETLTFIKITEVLQKCILLWNGSQLDFQRPQCIEGEDQHLSCTQNLYFTEPMEQVVTLTLSKYTFYFFTLWPVTALAFIEVSLFIFFHKRFLTILKNFWITCLYSVYLSYFINRTNAGGQMNLVNHNFEYREQFKRSLRSYERSATGKA